MIFYQYNNTISIKANENKVLRQLIIPDKNEIRCSETDMMQQ